jgi:hypothetical protein
MHVRSDLPHLGWDDHELRLAVEIVIASKHRDPEV